jgi:flagellar biosynthesis protein FliQ
MNVTSATDTTSKSSNSTTTTSSNSVDYNTFLQLLVAEMKYQDPTNPMDTAQYMSQFAQLSTVEQAMQTNSKLDALLSSQSLSQANGLIGKDRQLHRCDGRQLHRQGRFGLHQQRRLHRDPRERYQGRGRPRAHDQPVMNERDALDIVQAAIWTIIVASGPAVGAAMLVGTVIALIQALTQIQEVTLTFVPKIIVILLVVAVSGSFIGAHLSTFTEMVYSRIEHGF